MKIKEYMSLYENDLGELVKSVNYLIKEGWCPHGGISYYFDIKKGRQDLIQAMVKYEEKINTVKPDYNPGGSETVPSAHFINPFLNVPYETYVNACLNIGLSASIDMLSRDEYYKERPNALGNPNKLREPFLDWQENRPDNKPNANTSCLIKLEDDHIQVLHGFQHNVWTVTHSKNSMLGFVYEDDNVKKWAYIPE